MRVAAVLFLSLLGHVCAAPQSFADQATQQLFNMLLAPFDNGDGVKASTSSVVYKEPYQTVYQQPAYVQQPPPQPVYQPQAQTQYYQPQPQVYQQQPQPQPQPTSTTGRYGYSAQPQYPQYASTSSQPGVTWAQAPPSQHYYPPPQTHYAHHHKQPADVGGYVKSTFTPARTSYKAPQYGVVDTHFRLPAIKFRFHLSPKITLATNTKDPINPPGKILDEEDRIYPPPTPYPQVTASPAAQQPPYDLGKAHPGIYDPTFKVKVNPIVKEPTPKPYGHYPPHPHYAPHPYDRHDTHSNNTRRTSENWPSQPPAPQPTPARAVPRSVTVISTVPPTTTTTRRTTTSTTTTTRRPTTTTTTTTRRPTTTTTTTTTTRRPTTTTTTTTARPTTTTTTTTTTRPTTTTTTRPTTTTAAAPSTTSAPTTTTLGTTTTVRTREDTTSTSVPTTTKLIPETTTTSFLEKLESSTLSTIIITAISLKPESPSTSSSSTTTSTEQSRTQTSTFVPTTSGSAPTTTIGYINQETTVSNPSENEIVTSSQSSSQPDMVIVTKVTSSQAVEQKQ